MGMRGCSFRAGFAPTMPRPQARSCKRPSGRRPPVHGMIVQMTLRMCILVAGASVLLNQAALGCRHYRPSLGETLARAYAAPSGERPLALREAAACAQDPWRSPQALE